MVHPVEHWLLSDLCPLIHRHCGFRCTVYAGLPGVLIKPNVPLDSKFTFMQCVCICLSKLLNRCEALLSENTYLHYLLFLILLTENRCDTLLTENLSQSGTTDWVMRWLLTGRINSFPYNAASRVNIDARCYTGEEIRMGIGTSSSSSLILVDILFD